MADENYDEALLAEIEAQAELMLSVEQCALLFGVPERDFFEPGSDLKKAYDRGHLRSVCEIRKAVYKLAKQGSTPAQKQMVDFLACTVNANKMMARKVG